MKKIIMTILMIAAMMITISSCGGIKIDDIKGDWTVSTVNGKPVAEYNDSNEYANYKVTDKLLIYSGISDDGSVVTTEYAIKMTDKGFEASSDSTKINVFYDSKAATLNFDNEGKKIVLIKGTSDINSMAIKENEFVMISSNNNEKEKSEQLSVYGDDIEVEYWINENGEYVEDYEIFDDNYWKYEIDIDEIVSAKE